MGRIELYKDISDCCGCEACVNICKRNAIKMQEDEYGFLFPQIDASLCIECGQCKKVCSYQNENIELNEPLLAEAATVTDREICLKSASGGIFAALAKKILQEGGRVYGCAFTYKNGVLYPEHVRVQSENDLVRLQGSKYVQSRMGNIYKNVKKDLNEGRLVLFSGTPCQISALNSYLKNQEKNNLFTVDIICHGTPSAKLFDDYLKQIEKNINGKIVDFKFRDKSGGWGLKGSIIYQNKRNQLRKKLLPVQLSSYYTLFLDSETYRENCYSCKYAGKKRTGDITLGDYWGVEDEHPEILAENGGRLDKSMGISCVLINTKKGQQLLDCLDEKIERVPSSYEKIAKRNNQLKCPSSHSIVRDTIFKLYEQKGYPAIERWYFKRLGIKRYVYKIWNYIPRKAQIFIKKIV